MFVVGQHGDAGSMATRAVSLLVGVVACWRPVRTSSRPRRSSSQPSRRPRIRRCLVQAAGINVDPFTVHVTDKSTFLPWITSHARTIALLVSDIAQPFDGELAKRAEIAANSLGYELLLGDVDNSEDRLVGYLRTMPRRGAVGVVIASRQPLTEPRTRGACQDLRKAGTTLISAVQPFTQTGMASVSVDWRRVGYDAAAHLLAHSNREWRVPWAGL